MKPYDKLTIIRNRVRSRDLRVFRELVETYFERSEYLNDDMPVDWQGARSARSEINRMLPRVTQAVAAAGLDAQCSTGSAPDVLEGKAEVLSRIFSARRSEGTDQKILDVIDMAIGVYDASRFNALLRTVNPFHYALTALAFVCKIPKRAFATVFSTKRSEAKPSVGTDEIRRLEAAISRLAETEELIEMRFSEMREMQAERSAEHVAQIEDLAERLDFAERVIAQHRPVDRLRPRHTPASTTPV